MSIFNAIQQARSKLAAVKHVFGTMPALLDAAAIETEVVDPGKIRHGRPGLVLPGQLDRIVSVTWGRAVAEEVEDFVTGTRKIAPTTRYLLQDAVIGPGHIACRGGARTYRTAAQMAAQSKPEPLIELGEAALRSSFVGVHFFGHWLRDDTATHLLAETYGPVLAMRTPDWPDKPAYRALIGNDYVETGHARIGKLHIFDDIGQNDHKAARFRQLRARFADRAVSLPPSSHVVYVARGPGAKARNLINEDVLIKALAARGVAILRAEDTAVDTVVSTLQGARILVSVEGSQLSHGLLTLADKAGILAIQPPDAFFNPHMDWSHALDMHYAVVVGTPANGGFKVTEADLFGTLDLLDRAIG